MAQGSHVTRDSDTAFKVKRARSSPGRFAHRHVSASGGCSGGRENVLAVGNCCYVAVCSVAQGASAPTGEERGGAYRGGRPPTACYVMNCLVKLDCLSAFVACWAVLHMTRQYWRYRVQITGEGHLELVGYGVKTWADTHGPPVSSLISDWWPQLINSRLFVVGGPGVNGPGVNGSDQHQCTHWC